MNIELTGNTAYGKFEFSETVDHTYEPLYDYVYIGRANEVNVNTSNQVPATYMNIDNLNN